MFQWTTRNFKNRLGTLRIAYPLNHFRVLFRVSLIPYLIPNIGNPARKPRYMIPPYNQRDFERKNTKIHRESLDLSIILIITVENLTQVHIKNAFSPINQFIWVENQWFNFPTILSYMHGLLSSCCSIRYRPKISQALCNWLTRMVWWSGFQMNPISTALFSYLKIMLDNFY